MDIGPVLAAGRARAEARMTDTCQVGVEARSTVLNESTGEYGVTFTVVYDGPCEFRAGVRFGTDVDAASQLLTLQNSVLKLPVGTSAAVSKNMVAVISSSATDAGLVGTRARITGPFTDSYSTARRFQVEVVT